MWKRFLSLFFLPIHFVASPGFPSVQSNGTSSLTLVQIGRIVSIERVLQDNPGWRVRKIVRFAFRIGIKDYHELNKGFVTLYGCSFLVYRRRQRVAKAKAYISSGNFSIPEVGHKLGYLKVKDLNSDFQRIEGTTVYHYFLGL